MGKSKELHSFLVYAAVLLALLVLFLFLKKDGIVKWVEAGFIVRDQRREIEKLETEIASLKSETEGLLNDRDTLETFAREQLGFTRKGDDVYIVNE